MNRLEGKIALVTGAGSGIGRGTAIMFAKEGAKVIVTSRSENCKETEQMIREAGEKLIISFAMSEIKTRLRHWLHLRRKNSDVSIFW
jgi:NAD(P)-dependent dehydrogenase (short-subunit alcohol dehydrogenase family)